MPVFIKINESFVLSNSKDKDLDPEYKKPIVARFKKIKADTINLSLQDDYKDVSAIGFKCGPQNKVSGELTMNIIEKNIEIKCNAIFKINIRPQHKEKFLSNTGVWTFSTIQEGDYGDDIVGDVVKGLRVKKYKQKNRFGTFNLVSFIMTNVNAGSKKTDFK